MSRSTEDIDRPTVSASRAAAGLLPARSIAERAGSSVATAYAPWAYRLLLQSLEPTAMCRLLGTVAAERHAAPASAVTPRVVGEQQRAGRALAGLHVGK